MVVEPGTTEGAYTSAAMHGAGDQALASLPLAVRSDGGLVTPVLVKALADAILVYWRSLASRAGTDASEPLYLLDLAPGDGHLAWMLGQALQSRLTQQGFSSSLCYIACCVSAAAADALLAHPYLSDAVRSGRLDAVVLPGHASAALTLRRKGISVPRAGTPAVIVGLGHFQTLASQLACVHYGESLRGTPMATPLPCATGVAQAWSLEYTWSPLDMDRLARPLAALLAHYRKHITSAAVSLPTGALALLAQLRRWTSASYLLLSADAGVHDEQAIRMGALAPPAQWDADSKALPVNYHAISLAQRRHGACVWNRQIHTGGTVLHVAWSGPDAVCPPSMDEIIAILEPAHPDQSRTLRAMSTAGATPFDVQQCLVLLRLGQYDPLLLGSALAGLVRDKPDLSPHERSEWQGALARTWANYFPGPACDGFCYRLALLALHVGHIGLAKECMVASLAWYGGDADEHYLLAWCEAASNACAAPLAQLAIALQLAPDHTAALLLQHELTRRQALWDSYEWYLPALAEDDQLMLVPLTREQAPALLYQYRDPHIAVQTRLPSMNTVAQMEAWIDQQMSDTGQRAYALVHRCWGVVGMVGCHVAQRAGYFYYWIGTDHQGGGFGQRASRLCFRQLSATGVNAIYTSVDKRNDRSRYLMEKMGFRQLQVDALPPDDEQFFYYLGEAMDLADIIAGLSVLCAAINCPVQLTIGGESCACPSVSQGGCRDPVAPRVNSQTNAAL